MSRRRIVILAVPIVVFGLLLSLGSDRRPIANRSQKAVGSFVLDSAARVARLTAVEELRLDGVKEDFVPVFKLHVSRGGNIVVDQAKDYQYRFYSPDGTRLATLGRQGSGPGEFETFETRSGWVGDTLWVFDSRLHRITYATSAGKFVEQETIRFAFAAPRDMMRFPLLWANVMPIAISADGYLAYANAWNLPKPSAWKYENPVIAINNMGMIERVVGEFPFQTRKEVAMVSNGTHDIPIGLPLRIYPRFVISDDGTRLAYVTTHVDDARGGRVRLTIVASNGDTLVARDYPFVGTPISARVADSIIEYRASRNGRYADVIRRETKNGMAPVYPPVSAFVLGRDSSIWIGLRPVAAQRTWIVLDARGDAVGTLNLPERADIKVADKSNAWTVELDDDDVPSVVRYRIALRKD